MGEMLDPGLTVSTSKPLSAGRDGRGAGRVRHRPGHAGRCAQCCQAKGICPGVMSSYHD